MKEEFFAAQTPNTRHSGMMVTQPSKDKSLRMMLLAVLFQVSWPKRLTRREIIEQVPFYGESQRQRALYRDIETLTDTQVDDLPEPTAENLTDWCAEQRRLKRLAITYDRRAGTFGLAQSYRIRARKPPVIHPGDEAPFLLWRGEGSALRCLTAGIGPAMIGIDVLQ